LFERYTEHARRSIFFARYEASALFTSEITTEELLLGILREDKTVASRVGLDALIAIRKELEQLALPQRERERVPTSVDLPLSHKSKRALEYAAEEADALRHKMIDSAHLILGLMRVEGCLAAQLLRKHGLEYEQYRKIVANQLSEAELRTRPLERPAEWHQAEPVAPRAASFQPKIQALQQLVDSTAARLQDSDSYGDQRLKRKLWTRKEALGHLIDWAMAHQQWLTRALLDSKVTAAEYPREEAPAIQHYAEYSWKETVDLWVLLNRLLIHVLLLVPEDKLDVPCRIGIAEPVPLVELMDAYIEHCQDIVGQILARLD
jgi:hypothetical protein